MITYAGTFSTFTIHDLRDACSKQKRGKAVGLDSVAMEAIMHGGDRLLIHICLLFNMFLKFSFVPKQFMQCVIIPLVKNKSGDLSDVNNYRAISISTATSKLFETTIFDSVNNSITSVDYHLVLGLVIQLLSALMFLSKLLTTILSVVAMFLRAL